MNIVQSVMDLMTIVRLLVRETMQTIGRMKMAIGLARFTDQTKIIEMVDKMKELIRKLMSRNPENEIDEEDFWKPGGWSDDGSHWEQYDEMPWNG